jgi:hypothetical protein
MKKLITSMLVAIGCIAGSFAADTQYKVYDLQMTVHTTAAKGVTTTPCGDQYFYREKATRKINGVIAGCGCLAMAGDPTCENFQIYLWDATTKTQLTNFTFTTVILQRIGKKGTVVEHVATLVVEDQDGEKFELSLAGFGTYSVSKAGSNYDTMSVGGGVTGTCDAPYRVTPGSCNACGFTDGSIDQTTASKVCEDGICTESDTSDVTPVYGTYKMKYNRTKAVNCEKKGITAKTLGLPAYVSL